MQPERITSYVDLRRREIPDKRTVEGESTTGLPIIKTDTVATQDDTSSSQTSSPASDAALQREAIATRPDLVATGNVTPSLDTQRATALFKVHPDQLPNGCLDVAEIHDLGLKSFGNIVLIVTGPFGAGKDSVINALLKDGSLNMEKVVLYTTRKKSDKEVDGVDYHWVTREQFEKMRDEKELLGWNEVEPGYYGTRAIDVKKLLDTGKDVIAAVGPTVSKPLKRGLTNANIPFVEIFLSPLTKEELDQDGGIDKAVAILGERLRNRDRGGQDGSDAQYLGKLLERARLFLEERHQCPNIIANLNGKLHDTVENIKALIGTKKLEFISSLSDDELTKLSPQLRFLATGELPNISLDTTKFKANGNVAIIVTGPSGAGKDTLFKAILESHALDFTRFLSTTTRPRRDSEHNGRDYWFVSSDHFKKLIADNAFCEWVMVHNGYFFGKPVSDIQEDLNSGKDGIFALNVSGANYYKNLFAKLGVPYVDIFLSPVPKDLLSEAGGMEKALVELERRIRGRNSGETEEQIQDRLKVGRDWLSHAGEYSHIVENLDGKLDDAVRNFANIVNLARFRELADSSPPGSYSRVLAGVLQH